MARAKMSRYVDWSGEAPEAALSEPPAERRRRLDAQSKDGKRALEVDRSGSATHLEHAAKRLKHVKAEDRILRVPQWHMDKAVEAMRRAGVSGAVSNLAGTKLKRVKHRD